MLRPGGKNLLCWLEVMRFLIWFSLFSIHCFNGLTRKKDNMGSSCIACTMLDMRLVDGTLEHDLCYPGSEGLPAVSMCYVWPLLVMCRQSCCKAKSSVPLIAMGWSVLLGLSCNHHRLAEFPTQIAGWGCLYLSVVSPRKSCPRFTWHLVFGEDYETPLRQD